MSQCFGQLPFGISIGDCGPSSENIMDTKMLTESVSKSLNNNLIKKSTETIAAQDQTVILNGTCCQPFNVGQKLSMKMVSMDTIENEMNTTIKNSVLSNIDNSIDAKVKSSKGFLGSADTSKLKSAIKNYVSQKFDNEDVKNSIMEKAQKTIASQNQKVVINCGDYVNEATGQTTGPVKDTSCNITQDFVLDMFSQDLVQNVMAGVTESAAVNKAVNDLKSSLESKGGGLEDVVGALTGPFAIIVAAVVIGGLLFFFMGGKNIFTGGFNLLTNPKQLAMLAVGVVMLIVIIMMIVKLTKKKEEFYIYYE